MDETEEHGREIFIQDGILLVSASTSHSMDTNTSGSLSIVQLPNGKYSVEWKPNDLIMVEAEAQEDHEWAVVDTIGRRTRTFSGSNTNTDSQANSRIIEFRFDDLECYKITCKNRQITFIKKTGAECATFYFPNSNADTFAQNIKAYCNTVRSRHDKNTFIFTQPTAEMQVLNKSLAELELFQDNTDDIAWRSVGNIVSNFKKRPYEAAMEAFAKLSEIVYYSPDYPNEDVADLLSKSVGPTDCNTSSAQNSDEYEVVNKVPALPPRPSIPRGTPLGADIWEELKDSEGRIQESEGARHIIFRGGVQPSLRIEVWKYLLNYFPWNMTNTERSVLQKQKLREYYTMKQQWKSITSAQEARFTDFHERKSLVEKDVNRTDRTNPYYANDNNPNLTTLFDILMTYVMYNFDLGYVQGMSDLLSPILCLLDNEVDAFWCFVGFMDKVQNNFDSDQENMKFQLQRVHQLLSFTNPDLASYLTQHESGNMYFCFRWLLVLFKREFSQSDIMRLWEVLWTGLPCPNFHLLISVAILDTEKDTLMSRGYGFTEILKHVNDLSMQIDLHYILSKAEGIYYQVTQSSHLSDPIRIILGMKPVKQPESDKNASDTETEIVNGKNEVVVSANGISLQQDLEEVSYQKSIDMNYL